MMWNRDKYIERTYYTLEDLVIETYDGDIPETLALGETVDDIIQDMIEPLIATVPGTDTVLTDSKVDKLFCEYIYPLHSKEAICYSDDPSSLYVPYATWMEKFIGVLRRTYNKYIPLITYYAAAESALMDDISTTNVARFNDTPQNGGDYSSDTYTTNITETTSTTPAATKMARLSEIREHYEDLYTAWADEFNKLFTEI